MAGQYCMHIIYSYLLVVHESLTASELRLMILATDGHVTTMYHLYVTESIP